MDPEKKTTQFLGNLLKSTTDRLVQVLAHMLSFFRLNSEKTADQFREIFHSTSDQVREKAEETRRAVKLRMAVLEIEHHLNRLYPQIGKLTCDLAEEGKTPLLGDEDLASKIHLAEEYRNRLRELRQEQETHHPRPPQNVQKI